jgi:hypothetical protein
MYALLDPERSTTMEPGVGEVGCPGSLKKWNQRLIQMRHRYYMKTDYPCPRGYKHECFQCPLAVKPTTTT